MRDPAPARYANPAAQRASGAGNFGTPGRRTFDIPHCSGVIASCFARSSVADENIQREIADLLARRKSRGEMVGEFLREIAVLLVVFVPLEAMFQPGETALVASRHHHRGGFRDRICRDALGGETRMTFFEAVLVVFVVCMVVAAFGFYWKKQEEEEWRTRHRR